MAESKSNIPPKTAASLKRVAAKYNARTREADELRADLDDIVKEAKKTGTFREIASLADRSVAWVQGSLQRSQNRSK